MERNIRLTVEYEGTGYAGWQIQPKERTVQGEILGAIHRVTGQSVKLVGASRTDAGVHALAQVCNFHIDHNLEPERYVPALNFYLPKDILVLDAVEAPLNFHARFDAKHKRYRYLLAGRRSAVYRHLRWACLDELHFGLLQEAAALIVGEHDFSPFVVAASLKQDNRCRIDFARWYRADPLWIFEIRGNRFLHNMVRSLVGAMVNLAMVRQHDNMQNLTPSKFAAYIGSSTKERNVFTAPAHGLYLVSVAY